MSSSIPIAGSDPRVVSVRVDVGPTAVAAATLTARPDGLPRDVWLDLVQSARVARALRHLTASGSCQGWSWLLTCDGDDVFSGDTVGPVSW